MSHGIVTLSIFFLIRSQVRLVLLVLIVEESGIVELLQERRRWLVDIHIGHLLLSQTSCLLSSIILSFFSSFFCHLDLLKLLEDVLVVQKSMRKLVHKDITSQESLYSALNDRDLE